MKISRKLQLSYSERHMSLKLLKEKGAKLLILVPGAGLEPARTLPGPRDFKSRVSTNSTIRAQIKSITSGARVFKLSVV